MMENLTYNGYTGSAEVSVADDCLHGRLLFVNDLITYEGQTLAELKKSFRDAVDRYASYCHSVGKSPEKPCSGTFNVRLGPDLHRQAATAAMISGSTLNEFMVKATQKMLASSQPEKVVHEHRFVVEELQTLGHRLASSRPGQLNWEPYGIH
jgi:predicted HicB family RNase H-like nuclease